MLLFTAIAVAICTYALWADISAAMKVGIFFGVGVLLLALSGGP